MRLSLRNPFALFLTGFAASFILCAVVLAHRALADDGSVSMDTVVNEALDLHKTWTSMGIWAGLALVVKLLMDATKTNLLGGLFHKLSDTVQMLILLLLSMLSAGLAAKLAGGDWASVIGASLQSASGAMLLHEIGARLFGGMAPKPLAAPQAAPAPALAPAPATPAESPAASQPEAPAAHA